MSEVSTADLVAARKILRDLGLGAGEDARKLNAVSNLLDTEVARRRQKAIQERLEQKSIVSSRMPPHVVLRPLNKYEVE